MYYSRSLEEALGKAGLKMVNLEGIPYDPGMAAVALNIGDFDSNDQLIVDQVIEPVFMGKEGLVRKGTVTLRKAGA
jgi:hypothetical protein